MTYDKDAETVCLEFPSELAVGEAVVSFNYTGCLNDQMRGFYRSKYIVNGEERYAAVTQFEVSSFMDSNYTTYLPLPSLRLRRLEGRCLAGMSRHTRLLTMLSW